MLARHGEQAQHRATRLARAAAETAEIELGALLAGLVSRGEMRRVMALAVATYRAELLNVASLTSEQRKAVCGLLVEAFSSTFAT